MVFDFSSWFEWMSALIDWNGTTVCYHQFDEKYETFFFGKWIQTNARFKRINFLFLPSHYFGIQIPHTKHVRTHGSSVNFSRFLSFYYVHCVSFPIGHIVISTDETEYIKIEFVHLDVHNSHVCSFAVCTRNKFKRNWNKLTVSSLQCSCYLVHEIRIQSIFDIPCWAVCIFLDKIIYSFIYFFFFTHKFLLDFLYRSNCK